jgi:hypothetical protein
MLAAVAAVEELMLDQLLVLVVTVAVVLVDKVPEVMVQIILVAAAVAADTIQLYHQRLLPEEMVVLV